MLVVYHEKRDIIDSRLTLNKIYTVLEQFDVGEKYFSSRGKIEPNHKYLILNDFGETTRYHNSYFKKLSDVRKEKLKLIK